MKVLYASGILSKEEFVKLNVFHRRGFSFIVSIFVPLYFFITNDYNFNLNFILLIPFMFIFILLLIIMSKMLFKYSARKQFDSDPLARLERKYTITTTGITEQIIGKSHVDFKWSDVKKSFELDHLFVLYISNRSALLIPKKFFNSAEDISAFKEIANENLRHKIKRKFI
ncbi:hypothetical protein GGQ92_001512 [Gracilibacillus halotolerans]|uniref:YcxB-like C-terminal domain-containing protein n=1 Tax=Gracilibacillus halotolerans TaxID=74386 RepID=A0A841RMQ8_9BACI|nr:YcxB family protein [Gracilibacillus halotolerans]MBB6512726.1 hypothetical protein [Gracilibacillus halotolerans]